MHILHYAVGLIVSFIFSHVSSLKVPVKEIFQLQKEYEKRDLNERRAVAELEGVFHQHDKRITCLYDTLLQDLENDRDEADPFCRDFLNFPTATATNTVVTKT